jgi:hypothetical protein
MDNSPPPKKLGAIWSIVIGMFLSHATIDPHVGHFLERPFSISIKIDLSIKSSGLPNVLDVLPSSGHLASSSQITEKDS